MLILEQMPLVATKEHADGRVTTLNMVTHTLLQKSSGGPSQDHVHLHRFRKLIEISKNEQNMIPLRACF